MDLNEKFTPEFLKQIQMQYDSQIMTGQGGGILGQSTVPAGFYQRTDLTATHVYVGKGQDGQPDMLEIEMVAGNHKVKVTLYEQQLNELKQMMLAWLGLNDE